MILKSINAVFTISDLWRSPSSSDFHVRLETPWSKGNRVSSSTVISARVALALYNCTVLLPSLSALPHSGCPPIQCAHTQPHIPNYYAVQTHTIHTRWTAGESHSLRVCVLHSCTIAWDTDCVRECGTSARITTFKYFRLFQQLTSRKSDPWNSFKTL